MIVVRRVANHALKRTPFCGRLREVLRRGDYDRLDLAILPNIRRTVGHFHRGFDEIYFVLDGSVTVKLYDPRTKRSRQVRLRGNELCVIPKGVHHKIVAASPENRMCCICVPRFNSTDENRSARLEEAAMAPATPQ